MVKDYVFASTLSCQEPKGELMGQDDGNLVCGFSTIHLEVVLEPVPLAEFVSHVAFGNN